MSRIVWLIAFAGLSSVACSSSDDADTTQPVPEADDTAAASDSPEPSAGEPGTASLSEGSDGFLVLESRDEANNTSLFRCDRSCSSVCSDCLYEACLDRNGPSEVCLRSRDTCAQSCVPLQCQQGVGVSACYAPCLKGDPTCFIELGLVISEDPPRPDVLPGVDEQMLEQTRPQEETRPASEDASSRPSSSSSSSSGNGNSGRPADG